MFHEALGVKTKHYFKTKDSTKDVPLTLYLHHRLYYFFWLSASEQKNENCIGNYMCPSSSSSW